MKSSKYLNPDLLSKLQNLSIKAKYVVEGFMTGLHKSPYHGFSVEFSEQAQMLEKIHNMPSVRQHRIDAIKEAIATNSFLTEDKLDLAINRMIDDVAS